MKAAVAHVIRCAIDVQDKHGVYVTSVGVILKVKIGISAGEVNVLYVGNDEARSYLEMGRAVEAVNKAENYCMAGGDIVVGPSAWCHCSGLIADHELLPDQKHVKVKSLTEVTGPSYQMKRTIPVTGSMLNLDKSVTNLVVRSDLIEDQWDRKEDVVEVRKLSEPTSTLGDLEIHRHSSNTDISKKETVKKKEIKSGALEETTTAVSDGEPMLVRRIRRTVITMFDDETIDKLKLYVAIPVMRKIEEHQPLEYLSEMRQVSILFINLLLEKSTKIELAWTLQECFDVIYANGKRLQGVVSKIFLFDKGCTFIVVFGLPGFKHENDCAHALTCADYIYNQLNKTKHIEKTSIGVTTGPTYCGVVGHYHRHEYTVIGRKVNMAARLMMHYPGKVSV